MLYASTSAAWKPGSEAGNAMDWTALANFGLPGIMLGVLVLIANNWIKSNERIRMREIDVEDRKADTFATSITSLAGKVDAHHTADIQSHNQLGQDIAEIRGKLDEAIGWQERTPVEHNTPRPGTVYGLKRPGTRGDGG